jgi:DNA-binding transcriptional MerR regulator
MKAENQSLTELAASVNAWCEEHRVVPVSGQAAERISERNIRFYRTVGLVDAPESGGGRGYGEKHRLQVIAVRILQARGMPLRNIRELLQGRSIEDLRRVEKQGLEELRRMTTEPKALPNCLPESGENWSVAPLGPDFLLIAPSGRPIPAALREHLQLAIHDWQTRQS